MRKKIGVIGVDSGTVWVGDPCYLREDSNPHVISDAIHEAWAKGKFYAQMNYPLGHPGLGVVMSSYDGDGTYPVYGHFKEGEELPFKVEICFDEDDA